MRIFRFRTAVGVCLLLLLGLSGPSWSQAQESEPVETPQSRQPVADPNQLAPPRTPRPEIQMMGIEEASDLEPLRLDLRQAMTAVLQVSPNLDRARARLRQAEYRIDEAYTIVNPRADFSAQYSRVEPPVSLPGSNIVINPADNYQFALTLRQAIFTFGRLKWNTLAAKLSRRSLQEEYRGELNRLVLLTAQNYIDALLAQEAVEIAQDNLELQLANLRTSELLFEQGVAAQFDVFRNSAAAAQARQELIEARTAESVSKFRLMSLLDEPLDRPLELQPLALAEPGDIDLPGAKERALFSRPDLRSIRWAMEQAKAQVEVARTSMRPTLELQNQLVERNVTGFAPGTQNTTLLVLNIPLYDGGLARAQANQALEAVEQIAADLEQAERDAVLQVEENYYQLRDRWRRIQVAHENVKEAEEALRVGVLRYQNGISTNVELLDAQAARSRAHFGLARAKAEYLAARWSWWQATASEYPTEVPFPPEIREQLEAEGLPLGPEGSPDFLPELSEEALGVDRRPADSVPLPIRGLPSAPGEQLRDLEAENVVESEQLEFDLEPQDSGQGSE